MQIAETNIWMALPPEIFKLIHQRASSKALSETDKKLYARSSFIIDSIHLSPPLVPEENHPKDILVRLIRRYQHIRTLSIGDLGANEKTQVHALISYLKKNPPIHVRSLIFHEIEGTGVEESKEINQHLLEALSHKYLKSIAIRVLYETSILSGLEIQPALEKLINLRKFKLQCLSSDHPFIALSFAKQSKLISAHFTEFCEPMDTLRSVKSCPRLKELTLVNAHHLKEIQKLLSEASSERLLRLNISGIKIESDRDLDTITKAHPNLEHLNVTLGAVTDLGFQKIGENCTKLRSLLFTYPNVTDQSLECLSKNTHSLEALWIIKGFHITGKGIAAIAKNCLQLRVLKLFRIKEIDSSKVESIARCFKNLIHLEISFSGRIAIDDIRYLAENLPSLKVFKISNISGITIDDEKQLKAEFPHFF